jgi:hypothetical protein
LGSHDTPRRCSSCMPCLKAAIDRIGLVKFVEGVEKASGQGWQTRFIVLSQKPSYFYSNLLRPSCLFRR